MPNYSDRYYKSLNRQRAIPNVSLAAGGFTPAAFTPFVYAPKEFDVTPLQKSLAILDERKERTDQQRAAIRSALGKVKLNAAEDKWKNDYVNDIMSKIDNAAQFGDYSAALETATDLAGSALSDPALMGRVRANEQYEEEIKRQKDRVARGEISQNTYGWWLKNNPYKYSDIRDDNGTIVGGTEYEPTSRPVNDINWASAAMAAFKMVSPDKMSKSTDGSTTVHNNTASPLTRGKSTYKPGEAISSSGHSSQSQERVTKEQITARMEELLSATPDGYRQAEQAFDVAMYDFQNMVDKYNSLIEENPDSKEAKDLAQKIDQRKHLMYRNGSLIDYKEYYSRMITDSLFAEGLAYDWKTSSSGGSSSYSLSDVSRSTGGGGGRVTSPNPFQGAKFNYVTGQWEGALVRQQTDTESAQNGVSLSSTNIATRFE